MVARARVVTSIPVRTTAGSGLAVARANGGLEYSLDIAALTEIDDAASYADFFAVIYIPEDGTYRKISLADFLAAIDTGNFLLKDGTVALAADWSAGGNNITNLAAPTSDLHAATKKYVDDAAAAQNEADEIAVTPAGNIASTDVQAALEELDSEKQPLDADLTAIAALSTTAYGRALLTLADQLALRTAVGTPITILDYGGGTGETGTTNRTAVIDMRTALGFARVPPGTFTVDGGDITFDADETLEMMPGAVISLASGRTISVDGNLIAPGRQNIFQGTGTYVLGGPFTVYPEWFGVAPGNTASANTTAWNKFITDQGWDTPIHVFFGPFTYPFDAPFHWPQLCYVEGTGWNGTVFDLSGSDEHAVTTCYVDSGSITVDTAMAGGCNYSRFAGIYVDATDMTFTATYYRALMYAAGLNNSEIISCRFACSDTYGSQMDGILLVPSRAAFDGSPDYHQACTKNTVKDNRINNSRDGIVLGRHDSAWSNSEPARGGGGDNVGGQVWENHVTDNVLKQATATGSETRFGIVTNSFDETATSLTNEEKPYENRIERNTISFGSGYKQLTGDIYLEGSGTGTGVDIVGTGTAFLTELEPFLTDSFVSIQIDGESGTDRNVRVVAVTSDTAAEIDAADAISADRGGSGATNGSNVYMGCGIYLRASGGNHIVHHNHIENGYHTSLRMGNTQKNDSLEFNKLANASGRPLTWASDLSTRATWIVEKDPQKIIYYPTANYTGSDTEL